MIHDVVIIGGGGAGTMAYLRAVLKSNPSVPNNMRVDARPISPDSGSSGATGSSSVRNLSSMSATV